MSNGGESGSCPFCTLDPSRVVFENDLVIAIQDGYPSSPGHLLLVPRRHVADWFEATDAERAALTEATVDARNFILEHYQPEGFNIGINAGEAAGQTVMHLHVHVIPRYSGDVADPRGGIRWVLPDTAAYWQSDS